MIFSGNGKKLIRRFQCTLFNLYMFLKAILEKSEQNHFIWGFGGWRGSSVIRKLCLVSTFRSFCSMSTIRFGCASFKLNSQHTSPTYRYIAIFS